MARRTQRAMASNRDAIILIPDTGPSGTAAPPTVSTDGAAFTGSKLHPKRWLIEIKCADTVLGVTLVAPAIYIFNGSNWFLFKKLNEGNNLVITANQGYCEIVEDMALFDRVAFGATSISLGVNVVALPIIESEV